MSAVLNLSTHCLICGAPCTHSYQPTDTPLIVGYCAIARHERIAIVTAELYLDTARAIGRMFFVPRYEPERGFQRPGPIHRAHRPPRALSSAARRYSPRLSSKFHKGSHP